MAMLVPCWRIGWWMARWWRMQAKDESKYSQLLPMVRIGACRVGGAGKTPATMALTWEHLKQGKRVAVLCHDVLGKCRNTCEKVPQDADAQNWGDEAVLLAQTLSVDVWISRNRWKSWLQISRTQNYDLLISDDGLEDPRLDQAQTLLLDWGDGRTWQDLLPLGRCRSLVKDHPQARILRVGEDIHWKCTTPRNFHGIELPQGSTIMVLCGIGDPQRFLNDLRIMGYQIHTSRLLKDHSTEITRILAQLLAQTEHPIVITTKDAVKCTLQQRENSRLYTSEALTFLSSGW